MLILKKIKKKTFLSSFISTTQTFDGALEQRYIVHCCTAVHACTVDTVRFARY